MTLTVRGRPEGTKWLLHAAVGLGTESWSAPAACDRSGSSGRTPSTNPTRILELRSAALRRLQPSRIGAASKARTVANQRQLGYLQTHPSIRVLFEDGWSSPHAYVAARRSEPPLSSGRRRYATALSAPATIRHSFRAEQRRIQRRIVVPERASCPPYFELSGNLQELCRCRHDRRRI